MTEGETRDTQDADTRCVCWERGFDNTNCELRKDDSSRHPKGLEELSLRVATLILGSDVGTTCPPCRNHRVMQTKGEEKTEETMDTRNE